MIGWFKFQATAATNAKLAQAGPDGILVYLAILCQHTQHGRAGALPLRRCAPEILRIEAVALCGALKSERIERALKRCEQAQLIVREVEHVRIVGYDEDAMPNCVRCRKPNEDHHFATCPRCREKREGARETTTAQPGAQQGAPCAAQGAPDRTGQDPTGPDRTSTPGASAQGVPERGDPEPDEPDPVLELQRALTETSYRSKAGAKRRWVLARRARELAATGLTAEHVPRLVELAQSGESPDGLFAHWLDQGIWREVLDEHDSREREKGARKRGADARRAVQ